MIALLGAAWAQQSCIEPMSPAVLEERLRAIEAKLLEMEVVGLQDRVGALTERLPCLEAPIAPDTYARFARVVLVAYFFRQEEEQVARWSRSERWADPDLPWSPVFPPGHALRRIVDAAGPPDPVDADRSLVPPPGGGVFANGRLLDHAEAPADTPVFVQVFDRQAHRVLARFQDGPTFPAEVLGDPSLLPPPPPRWLAVDPPEPGGPAPRAERPPRAAGSGPHLGALATGLGLLAASGACYTVAGVTAGGMRELRTAEDLTAARTRANALVLASGVTLAAGVGLAGGGLLLAGRF